MDTNLVKTRLTQWRFFLLIASAFMSSCTSKTDERVPANTVMHFPQVMAQHGAHIAVSASSADGKYHRGRLMVMDSAAIKDGIANNQAVSLDSVVHTNVMVPLDTGEMVYSDNFLMMAGRENSQLIALPIKNGVAQCNDSSTSVGSCAAAGKLILADADPFAIAQVGENSNEEIIVVSYLSSDLLDVIAIDKTTSALSIQRSLRAMDLVAGYLDDNMNTDQRVITRKIMVTNKDKANQATVYFLLEQHSQKITAATKPRAAFIVAIKTSDLQSGVISNREVWNLNKLGAIAGVTDVFVDESKREAFVLARSPEALFKIDLTKKSLIEIAAVCTGTTSMAIDEKAASIIIPCFSDNRVTSLSMDTLSVKATSKVVGRGPSSVIIDPITDYVFCTLSIDGVLVVLDKQLNYLGHVFDKAPLNRVGS